MYTVEQAKQAIMNKWDWENPNANIPIFLWGSIGIGKTNCVQDLVASRMIYELENNLPNLNGEAKKKAARELERLKNYDRPKEVEDLLERHLLTLRLAERPIEQLQGVPAPDFERSRTVFLMPENVQKFQQTDWCVVFVDELDKADEAKMTAATHLIEARRIGDFVFPSDTMIIAAANRVTDSFISKPIVPELRNRAAHIELVADVEAWVDWAKKKNVEPSVVRFIEYKFKVGEQWLAVYDDANDLNYSFAFPTPRTWHAYATQHKRLVAKNEKITNKELLRELEQFVGNKAMVEFETYYSLYSTIDVMDILTGKKTLPVYSEESERTYNQILSDQYIYMFAVCDQMIPEHLDNDTYKDNFLKFVFALNEELRTVFFQNLTSNEVLLNRLLKIKELSGLIDEVAKDILAACMNS